jgi:Fe-Mn family superoxide dismutase
LKRELPALPYAKSALAPHISARTVTVHYEKHHRGYLDKLAKLLRGKPEEDASLEDLVRHATGDVFDNAAQAWNHAFYWRSLRPGGGGRPSGAVRELIVRGFGSVADFKRQLGEAATTRFGSGWAWVFADARGRLRIESRPNAENPLQDGGVPLLVIDVWEHAYYLDYQNERDRYVRGVLDHLLDWDFLALNLEEAQLLQSRTRNP